MLLLVQKKKILASNCCANDVLLWPSRCLPLWVGARGIEFDWKYIQMSFDSNISLVSSCALLLCSLFYAVCL